MTIDITVSIVSYNTRDLLRACLRSLQTCHEAGEAILEVIVADNASSDGSPAMVHAEFPWVTLIETGGNLGYGRANNLALAKACGRHFLILNSDTELEPGALAAMRDFLDTHPDAGAVGAKLILPGGRVQDSCGRDPRLSDAVWEQTYLSKVFPNHPLVGSWTLTNWDYGSVRSVDQICAACLLVRREAWEQTGFDPAFFMYFEDIDLCLRLRRAGWKLYFVPEAVVLHHHGASSADWPTRARMVAANNQSRYLYYTRHEGKRRGQLLKAVVLMGAGLRFALWSLLSLFRPSAHDQVKLFREVCRLTWAMRAEKEPDAL